MLSKRVGSTEGGLAVVEVGRGGRSLERYSDDDDGGRGRGRAEEEEPFSERASSEAAELRDEERRSTGPVRTQNLHNINWEINYGYNILIEPCQQQK